MLSLIGFGVAAAALLASCSDSDPIAKGEERLTLILDEYDISMADYRLALREDMAFDQIRWRVTCSLFEDADAAAAWDELRSVMREFFDPASDDVVTYPDGAVRIPGQTGDVLGLFVAQQIVVEECSEAFPYFRR